MVEIFIDSRLTALKITSSKYVPFPLNWNSSKNRLFKCFGQRILPFQASVNAKRTVLNLTGRLEMEGANDCI